MRLTELIDLKNKLIRQGQVLADGKQSDMTLEEWLEKYHQVEDDLEGVQAAIIGALAIQILRLSQKKSAEEVVV